MPVDVETTYRRYGPMVLRRCRRLLRDEQEAVDAMQDVFVQLLRRRDTLEDRAPSSLLYRMATNVCLNRLRHNARHPEDREEALLASIAGAGDVEGQGLGRRVVARLFGGEKDSTRTIAVLHHLDGMTLDEVAREVGMSVSGVRKRLRGLQVKLRGLEGAQA